MNKLRGLLIFFLVFICGIQVYAQCGGIMEPGFKFLTSSRGCAPYSVTLETFYLSSVPGTVYYVNWGDGTPEEVYTQTNATGVTVSHNYPNSSIDCGYDLVIDASNGCNPRGSVVPINTQVIVWTHDIAAIDPAVFRVCQGFAETLSFTDNSIWNCFPRPTRENNEPRWIQWIYGTGPAGNQIPGIKINGNTPGSYPYLDPTPNSNPIYPVTSPGQLSLPINVPVTTPADLGKEFYVTLKNWNQCNAYDNNLLDGNPYNPVNGDLVNGDNASQTSTAKIIIVPSPQPSYVTRAGSATGPLQSIFCAGDFIYFDNQTPGIPGSSFAYSWKFYDDSTGTGAPVFTSLGRSPSYAYKTSGKKLIRLSITDRNAVGGCVNTFDGFVTISPSPIAKIKTTDLSNNPITPNFCQNVSAPFTTFQVRFSDASVGAITPTTRWRWEFYDENNTLITQVPASGFSSTQLGPFDRSYVNLGIYKVRLVIHDSATGCETQDEVQVRVYQKPVPLFTSNRVCEGQANSFRDNSTLKSTNGEKIVLREWDFNFDGSFDKDPAFDNQTSFTRVLGVAGTYQVALKVTADQNGCSDIFVSSVTVDPPPIATFVPDVTSGCSILTVNFTNNSVIGQPDTIDRFVWEVDEKQGQGFQPIATQRPSDPNFTPNLQHKFSNTGTSNKQVDVHLRVYTIHGCEKISPPVAITIFPGPKSGFSETNYSPFNSNCSPQQVNFSADAATQSLNPSDYTWTVSDNSGVISSSSSGTTASFSFKFSNTTQSLKDFSVKLTTTLSSGCKRDSVRTIRISPVPISTFTIDTAQFDCQTLKVNLIASQPGLSAYHWQISENGTVVSDLTSTADQFPFTFTRTTADISVQFSLDTKNFANCPSSVATQNFIVPKIDNMGVSFNVSPVTQTFPASTVTLTNTTNAGPWTYLWNFGDGTTSTDPSTSSHTYTTFGNYSITLTATSSSCSESQTHNITILGVPPVVDFTYAPSFGCQPLIVQFTNLTQYADPGSYVWDFGDGGSSQLANPSHVYINSGNYSVTLTAGNSEQRVSKTKPAAIQVFARPIASFNVTPQVIQMPATMYTSNSSQYATSFYWDFGDGVTSVEVRPEHTYKKQGNYTITLIASNDSGCSDTLKMANVVLVERGGQVLVPNAFSPGNDGGDGHNDVFLPVMQGITQFEMQIFNRWGQLLFVSHDASTGWNGYYNGKLCEQDVYVYKLTVTLDNGQQVVKVGDVNLIR